MRCWHLHAAREAAARRKPAETAPTATTRFEHLYWQDEQIHKEDRAFQKLRQRLEEQKNQVRFLRNGAAAPLPVQSVVLSITWT